MPWNRKDYPDDWEDIRKRILIRANDRCEKCNVKNHALINKSDRTYATKNQLDMYHGLINVNSYSKLQARRRMDLTLIVLTIAHINHDKENHEVKDEDLAAYCQKCHLSHDMSHHVQNRKYGRNYRKSQHKLF